MYPAHGTFVNRARDMQNTKNVNRLLDSAKKTCLIESDNALAQRFGVHRQAVSKWRTGESYPSEDHIARLAEMAHEDAGIWLARIQAERAQGKAAIAWESIVKRLAATAAACLALMLIAPPGKASEIHQDQHVKTSQTIHYAKWRSPQGCVTQGPESQRHQGVDGCCRQ